MNLKLRMTVALFIIFLSLATVFILAAWRSTSKSASAQGQMSPQAASMPGSSTEKPQMQVLASGGPAPMLSLPNLTREADLIVVGQIDKVTKAGHASQDAQKQGAQCGPVNQMTATLHVLRVVKGQFDGPDLDIGYLLCEAATGALYGGVSEGKQGMFFLHSTESQNYVFADRYYPFVIAVADAPPIAPTDTEFDRVVAEVAHALSSPVATYYDRQAAISALEFVKSRAALTALRHASRDNDAKLGLQATASLLRHNDISGLDAAVDMLLNPPADIPNYLIAGLGYSIQAGVTDERAVPALTRLFNSPIVENRKVAVTALGQTHSKAASEVLTKALDDTDQQVRYKAVTGLAQVTGETDGMPSLEFFQKSEQGYLKHWREKMKRK